MSYEKEKQRLSRLLSEVDKEPQESLHFDDDDDEDPLEVQEESSDSEQDWDMEDGDAMKEDDIFTGKDGTTIWRKKTPKQSEKQRLSRLLSEVDKEPQESLHFDDDDDEDPLEVQEESSDSEQDWDMEDGDAMKEDDIFTGKDGTTIWRKKTPKQSEKQRLSRLLSEVDKEPQESLHFDDDDDEDPLEVQEESSDSEQDWDMEDGDAMKEDDIFTGKDGTTIWRKKTPKQSNPFYAMDNLRARHKGRFAKAKKAKRFENLKICSAREKSEVSGDNNIILEGSRIVDVMFLAQQLICSGCDNVLSLLDIVSESVIGLASKWTINCRQCGIDKSVCTSKSNTNPETNRISYSINIKAALGMLDAGIGPTHANAFLTCLNVPAVTESLLKRSERIVGPAIEDVANKSCLLSSTLEKTLEASITQESVESNELALPFAGDETSIEGDGASNVVSPGLETTVAASYDMGWQKRGNGRSYSSLTGHGCLIGIHSKKVLSFGTRNAACKACSYSNVDHDCRRNWSGSAKAMEADLAVELLTTSTPLKAAQVKVGTIVCDEDSSTIAKIRRDVGNVEKVSDINHAKKNLGNALYGLRMTHKQLTPTVIKYLQRCFGYALQQNRGNPASLRKAIMNIVPHSFDCHGECGPWCGFVKDPVTYFHRGLPRGLGLEGETLCASLNKVFEKFGNIANSLAPCGSTQGNESFNAIVASKAPKSRHYGSSESNDYRVAAAVCQKNVGVGYVADVKKSLMLSPGSNTNKHRQWLARKRMAVMEKKKSLSFKRRRLFKNLKKGAMVKSREAREGETYRSGMGMDGDATLISPQVLVPVTREYSLIIFDVETTGLCNSSEIIQVGAVGASEFSVYIKPSGPIPERISELTGLSVRDGEMWRGGKKLVHHSAVEGLKAFIQFLSKSERGALLVGHNVNFDARMIVAAIQKANLLEDFMSVVVGFADSCPIFKKLLPGRQSYRQECLFKDIIGESVSLDPHNALNDSLALKMLMSHMDINNEHIIKESFSLDSFIRRREFLGKRKSILLSLSVLRDMGISQYMVGRLADEGLSFGCLREVYRASGEEGVKDLILKKKVTKSAMIVNKLQAIMKKCSE
ncbi:uncharacterized protein LOC124172766 [Ischnura elegans]|uniref:uncharacterized protein LOC124172766 n=1 Tax=Ischnura elegans TaxID=197161 RepID=UPI001ED8A974|nr:uncharacterized protein LOC124172766 [Ischnura elegans]